MTDESKAKVLGVLASVSSNAEAHEIRDDTSLESLGMDSLSVVELKIRMKHELGCEIPDHELMEVRTVQDLLLLIENVLPTGALPPLDGGGSASL
jgi:acyl carrier protein